MRSSKRLQAIVASGMFALLLIASAQAQKPSGRSHCPRCKETCTVVVSKSSKEKSCFEVETRAICIPAITFPWQRCYGGCGDKGCGKVGCSKSSKSGCGCGKSDGKGKGGKNGQCDDVNCAQPTKCGRVRYVNVLVKKTFSCPSCKYTWSAGGDKGINKGSDKGLVPTKAEPAAPLTTEHRHDSSTHTHARPVRVHLESAPAKSLVQRLQFIEAR